jgi:hypothetical protein
MVHGAKTRKLVEEKTKITFVVQEKRKKIPFFV